MSYLRIAASTASATQSDGASNASKAVSEDEAKDLPPEEFLDFLNTLDSDAGLSPDGTFKTLDEALLDNFDLNAGTYTIILSS